ncbi:MAG: PorP/SprF family type IX secretion system membrane protein [Saprospiraceae bacterium]|jgi:type IX secretion system PorP/SprF family membrane protein|nr:PorP/SprF family type IX secretion system membrane protein [Saprospiraceae bacterium]
MKINFTLFITFLTLTFIVFSTENAEAQDPQFRQFYAAPMHVNPAMTGVHSGKFRVGANYRQQWNSVLGDNPFKTVAASYDMKFGVGRDDFFAFGASALQDWAGESNFKQVKGDLSVSYLKALGGGYRSADQFLVGGAQVGVGQNSIDVNGLWFSNQFNTTNEQIDFGAPTGEPGFSDATDMYLNMNAGIMWYAVFDHNASVYVGGALHHINGPKVSFIGNDGDEVIPTRWVGQVGGEVPFNDQLSILPAVMVTGQGPSMLAIFGFNLRFTNRDWREVAIRAGVWPNLVKDEIDNFSIPNYSVSTTLEMERVQVGISYDVNANKLSDPTNGRGGVELSVIYVHPGSRKEKVSCPKY